MPPQNARDPDSPPTHRLWRVTPQDSDAEALSVSRCPPCTAAQMAIDDPGSTLVAVPSRPVGPRLADADRQLADAVLRAWGEDDKAIGKDWIDGLARDPERLHQRHAQARALGIASAEEPAQSCRPPNPPPRS
jgi:hypothetical protein